MAQPIHKSFALHMSLVLILWVVGSGCWSIPTGRTSLHNPDRPNEVEEGILHYEERLHRKWRRTWEPIYKTGYYGKKISQQIEQYRIGLSGFDMKVLNSLVRLPPEEMCEITDDQLNWAAGIFEREAQKYKDSKYQTWWFDIYTRNANQLTQEVENRKWRLLDRSQDR